MTWFVSAKWIIRQERDYYTRLEWPPGHTKKHVMCSFCLISIAVKKFGCGSTPIVSGQRLIFGPWWIGFYVTALVCVYVKFRANRKTRVFLFWCMNIAGYFFLACSHSCWSYWYVVTRYSIIWSLPYIDPFSFRSTRGEAATLSLDVYHATDHYTYGLCGMFPRKNLFFTSFCGQIRCLF